MQLCGFLAVEIFTVSAVSITLGFDVQPFPKRLLNFFFSKRDYTGLLATNFCSHIFNGWKALSLF